MASIFRFTDGVTADSISGPGPHPPGSPFDTGTPIPRPTTRQEIFDALDSAMVATGMIQHVKTASTDIVYESNGENGNENFGLQMELQTATRYLYWYIAPKLSISNDLEARVGNGATNDFHGRWDLGSVDFTADMFILASKDHLFAFVEEVPHGSGAVLNWVSIGLGKRTNRANPNVYALNSAATAGEYATLDVAPNNPLADGYRPGEYIEIIETDKSQTVKAHRLYILGATTSTFEVRNLPESYAIGARVGANASPLIRGAAINEVPDDPDVWVTPFFLPERMSPMGSDMLAVNNNLPFGAILQDVTFSVRPGYASEGEFGIGNSPNKRTQRFTCRTIGVDAAQRGEFARVPNLLTFPGNVNLYPHDVMIADRLVPQRHFIGFCPNTGTTERWCVGPIP